MSQNQDQDQGQGQDAPEPPVVVDLGKMVEIREDRRPREDKIVRNTTEPRDDRQRDR